MARRDGSAVLEGRALQLDHVIDQGEGGRFAGDLLEAGADAPQGMTKSTGDFLEHSWVPALGRANRGWPLGTILDPAPRLDAAVDPRRDEQAQDHDDNDPHDADLRLAGRWNWIGRVRHGDLLAEPTQGRRGGSAMCLLTP
jgi:hypothetical protein